MKPISINKLTQILDAEPKMIPGDRRQVSPQAGLGVFCPHPHSAGFRVAGDEITGVCTDSRTVKAGDCFFAIAGEKFDGHNFLDQVFEQGASCVVVSKEACTKFADKPVLKVADTIESLGRLAHFYRNDLEAAVIAITGSVGKTTTRQIIYNCLSRRFAAVQSPKSFNNNIGLPLTILSAPADTKVIVAELGSNHPGEIGCLTKIACPDIALVTNVHPAHLAGFDSIDAIAAEKSSIADGLRPNGTLIINADQPLLTDACRSKKTGRLITFGTSQNADIRADNIKLLPASSRFIIDDKSCRGAIDLPLPGPGNVQNALAAWAVCRQLNIELADFAASLRELPAVTMRAEILQIGQATIISDCYNANPASMANALQILANFDTTGNRRLVFFCGDMNELGKDSLALHEELGQLIARSNISLLVTAGPLSEAAAKTAKQSAKNDIQIFSYPDAVSACNNLQKFIEDTDIILVKGSRAVGLEAVIEKIKMLYVPEKHRLNDSENRPEAYKK
jgi:UDP-N-acetylmuramoyl-tripeptide--D-alanyl-D-alanine ligase